MDGGGIRPRPRGRSTSRDNPYHRPSRGGEEDWRRRRSASPFQDNYRDRRRRRERSRSRLDEYRRRERSRRSPGDRYRYEEEYDRRQRRRQRTSSGREDDRHKPRRRQRRSPTSPSTPRQQPTRHTGVVSEDDEGLSRPLNEKPQQNRARSSSPQDDSKGHFKGGEGTIIANRYRVLRDVGLGTFGRVVEAVDLKRSRRSSSRRDRDSDGPRVAIKIVRDVKRYCDSALIEADIVEAVNRRGGRGTALCAMMFDSFTWKSHYCLVFECLGPSLYDFMKKHDYQPFPMVCVRDFAMQLLEALEFLHSFGLIHTDLKPENILLVSSNSVNYNYRGRTYRVPESTRIKLVDFGGATYDNDTKKSSIVNTRQYRSPEVILSLGWSMPSDLWSCGCILAELYMGELLFATHDNVEHLALIEKCIGPFPRRMLSLSSSKLVSEAFDSSGRHRLDRVLPSDSASYVRKAVPIEVRIRPEDDRFLQMLRRILVIDPDARMPAHECLRYRL